VIWQIVALAILLAIAGGSIAYRRRRSPEYRAAERQLDQLRGRETIDRMLRGEWPANDSVPARIVVLETVVPAGAITTLRADDEIIHLNASCLIEPRRTGAFRPMRLYVGQNHEHFQIVDVRVGGVSQFRGGDPVPAEIFDPRYSDTDVMMDTLAPEDLFEIEVRNTSELEREFNACVEGRYSPKQAA